MATSARPPCRGWDLHAACLGIGPEAFFPLGTTGAALEQALRAKAICASCEVREECLDWALTTYQEAGIWGGLTEDERRSLRRSRQRRH